MIHAHVLQFRDTNNPEIPDFYDDAGEGSPSQGAYSAAAEATPPLSREGPGSAGKTAMVACTGKDHSAGQLYPRPCSASHVEDMAIPDFYDDTGEVAVALELEGFSM